MGEINEWLEARQKRFMEERGQLLAQLPVSCGPSQPDGVGDQTSALWHTFTDEQKAAIIEDGKRASGFLGAALEQDRY